MCGTRIRHLQGTPAPSNSTTARPPGVPDARTAYLIDPNDLIRVHKEAKTKDRPIKAFYHSHPNHDAYFSEKDKTDATAWDEPVYPGAAYIVVSVYGPLEEWAIRKQCDAAYVAVKMTKTFAWNEADADFVEVPIDANYNT